MLNKKGGSNGRGSINRSILNTGGEMKAKVHNIHWSHKDGLLSIDVGIVREKLNDLFPYFKVDEGSVRRSDSQYPKGITPMEAKLCRMLWDKTKELEPPVVQVDICDSKNR
jgi:hypothetical protein